MHYGQFVWNDEVAQGGKVWVLVNLGAQTISVFRGQHEIGTAVALYGVDGKPTPLGRFRVLEMRKDHQSSIYDAEMPYTLKLSNDGIAIHGSDVRAGVGTHGCIGIPLEFASKLFGAVDVGTEVFTVRRSSPDSPPVTAAPTS
jgi:lipoprotein-anchoring transpeptidase ErfK/SrfK